MEFSFFFLHVSASIGHLRVKYTQSFSEAIMPTTVCISLEDGL
jgi:hypothetical protein